MHLPLLFFVYNPNTLTLHVFHFVARCGFNHGQNSRLLFVYYFFFLSFFTTTILKSSKNNQSEKKMAMHLQQILFCLSCAVEPWEFHGNMLAKGEKKNREIRKVCQIFVLIFEFLQFNHASSALMLLNKIIYWKNPFKQPSIAIRNELKPTFRVLFLLHSLSLYGVCYFFCLFHSFLSIFACVGDGKKTTRRCFDVRFFSPSLIFLFHFEFN